MFTGIIESLGTVLKIEKKDTNLTFFIQCNFLDELKIDQSVAHNGVCLTVDGIFEDHYSVTAIKETLDKTNLGNLSVGNELNLERCLKVGDRLDGHIVQGHVDGTGIVTEVKDMNGSWEYHFEYPHGEFITVSKGSICVNGVSLTVVNSGFGSFSVAIIPYTYEHTNFHELKAGDKVNLEFDIVGKYILASSHSKNYVESNK